MASDTEAVEEMGEGTESTLRAARRRARAVVLRRARRIGGALAILILLGLVPTAGGAPGYRLTGTLCNQNGSGYTPTRNKVAMAVTPDGKGYWLMQDDGGIFPYGDATGWGSAGANTLGSPMVGMASTPSGRGYWLVERRGMVWAYGDAVCHGGAYDSTANDFIGIVADHSGGGYWLVEADGGIWPYGDAPQGLGCVPCQNVHLTDIVAMAATPDGGGYWMMEANGGIWPYGDAGQCCGRATSSFPFVAIVATPASTGLGYWEIDSIGGVYPIGSASGYLGSLPGLGYNVNDISGMGITMDGRGMFFERKNGQVIPIGNAGSYQ